MKQVASIPRLMLSAPKGGSGKTICALGIARAFCDLGLKVVAFKKGPDYIDAKWLSMASQSRCYNLDPFLMDQPTIIESFNTRSLAKDIAVIEGNRGLYDGVDVDGTCSTGELAKLLGTPVIIVLDCTKMTRTAAAVALGLKTLDPQVEVKGVLLNHIVTSRHEGIVKKAIENYTGLPVLGVIPRMKNDPMPMRHLGVTPVHEHPDVEACLKGLATMMKANVDLKRLIEIARSAGAVPEITGTSMQLYHIAPRKEQVRIGVIMDEAFHFYYPENLEALQKNGAEIVPISALKDADLPEVDLLYIGGGFPETKAQALSRNHAFRQSVKERIELGLPVYAECGGLMYLGQSIFYQGNEYPMVGALDLRFTIEKKPQGHGYSVLRVNRPTPFYSEGTTLHGHEFHYSRPVESTHPPAHSYACSVLRGKGIDGTREGILYKNVFATYTHCHVLQQKDWGARVVNAGLSLKRSYNIQTIGRVQKIGLDKKKPHRL